MEAIKDAVFSEYMPFIAYVLFRSLVLFAVGLGSVYIVGRMLGFINSNRGRNAIAALAMTGGAIWTTMIYDEAVIIHPHEYIWRPIVYLTVACLLYVILGFKFAGRLDNVLNKKMAKESETHDIGTKRLEERAEKKEEKKKRADKVIQDVFTKLMK